jgi:hypothetical protein
MIEFLYQALNSELGVIVRSSNPVLLRSKLYPLIKSDPALDCISLVLSPTAPDTDLFLVRKPNAES